MVVGGAGEPATGDAGELALVDGGGPALVRGASDEAVAEESPVVEGVVGVLVMVLLRRISGLLLLVTWRLVKLSILLRATSALVLRSVVAPASPPPATLVS